MDGFLFVNKPKGMTSLSVCNYLKRKLNLKKCGHSGTLDPNTTGVLVVACNNATKLLKLINEHDKEYEATISFGYDSDTLDVDGVITNNIKMDFSLEALENAIFELSKVEEQIPPMTSAIKINGKKLYEYQRKGIEIELKPRKIKIYDYSLLSNIRNVDDHLEADVRLNVSKGFYVRSYARDLGRLLGGCAILKELKRTKAGEFTLEKCKSLDEIEVTDIIPIEDFFTFPKVEVNDYIAKLVRNGVMLDERQAKLNEVFFVTHNCDIIAVYECVDLYKYKPILIFK